MSARTIGGRTLWSTRWGPLVVIPRAGLTWNAKTAYALRDANSGNARMLDGSLAFARARSVQDMHQALAGLGLHAHGMEISVDCARCQAQDPHRA